jgi:16S rRNA (guanine527-N7)-methyltransferase
LTARVGAGPDGVTRRLADLALRHGLTDPQLGQLRCLLEVLASDPHTPSAVTGAREAVDVHVADALSALDLDVVRASRSIADLGSGAGLPGLPLAVALPAASVWLIESSGRRCEFIDRARSAAGVANASVVAARVEDWRERVGELDLVTARALAPLDVLCEYAAPLLRPGGALVAWRGRRDATAEAAGGRAATQVGLEPREPVRSTPYPGSHDHHLHVYVKVRPTPSRFPRRPGMASKRPLGAST